MVGTVCLVSQYVNEFALRFDQYLVNKIYYQLEHFHSNGKTFIYQTLLMLMVITENLAELRQIEPVNFSEGVDLFQRNATISFFYICKFSNACNIQSNFWLFNAKDQ